MNVDDYLFREFVEDRYTCLEFTSEVWQDLTGEDLRERLGDLFRARAERKLSPTLHHRFTRLSEPESPCLVLMTQLGMNPHLGVFFEGSLLHLNRSGPEYLPVEIAGRGFTSFRYYK